MSDSGAPARYPEIPPALGEEPVIRSRIANLLVLTVAVVVLASGVARAAPGDRDHSFGGGDGIVKYDGGGSDAGQKILRQPDGKIVVAGQVETGGTNEDLFLGRYTSSGAPDTTFGGGDGVVRLDFLGGYDDMWALNRYPDGRLIVAGYAEDSGGTFDHIAVARFTATGKRDTTFSGDGKTTTAISGYPSLFGWRSVLQDNGKLVVVGEAVPSGGGGASDLLVVRYRTDGHLDPTFSGDGKKVVNLGGDDYAWDVRLLDGGTILAAGSADSASEGRMSLVWLTPSGSLDTARGGGDGKAIVDMVPGNSTEVVRAVFVLSSGKLLVVGEADKAAGPGTGIDVFEARLMPNGGKDTTFGGGDGVVGTDGGDNEVLFGAKRQSDGKVVAAGFNPGFFVVRLRKDGTADGNFGTGGFSKPVGGGGGRANDVVIQPDGRIVVTGDSNDDVATLRLLA
jgi:uncharacterized delta-60 repeat protein